MGPNDSYNGRYSSAQQGKWSTSSSTNLMGTQRNGDRMSIGRDDQQSPPQHSRFSPKISLPPLASLTDIDSRARQLATTSNGIPSRQVFLPRSESESALSTRFGPPRRREDRETYSQVHTSSDRHAFDSRDGRAHLRRLPSRDDHFDYVQSSRGHHLPHSLSQYDRFSPILEPHDRGYAERSRFSDAYKHGRCLNLENNDLKHFAYKPYDAHEMQQPRSYSERVNPGGEQPPLHGYSTMTLPSLRSRETRLVSPGEGLSTYAAPTETLTQNFGHSKPSSSSSNDYGDARGPLWYHNTPHSDAYYAKYPTLHHPSHTRNPESPYTSDMMRFNSTNATGASDSMKSNSLSPQQQHQLSSAPAPESKKRLVMVETSEKPVSSNPTKYLKTTKATNRANNNANHVCQACQATATPEWRKGPTGPRTLCNACGLLYAKMCRKREQDAVAAAVACGRDPAEARKEVADELLQPERREEILESLRGGVRVVANAKQQKQGNGAASK